MFYSVLTHSIMAAVLSFAASGLVVACETDGAPVEAEVILVRDGNVQVGDAVDIDAILAEIGLNLDDLAATSTTGVMPAKCVVMQHGQASAGQPCPMAVTAAAGVPGGTVWVSDDHAPMQFYATAVQEVDLKPQGWLGVSIGEVPPPLAAQLGTDNNGVIILNVAGNSPADEAGLMEHDILLAIDGKPIASEEDNIMEAVALISANDPGTVVQLRLLRSGKPMELPVTLGERPAPAMTDWKLNVPPMAEIEEDFSLRGRMMVQDDEGNWTFKDLGDLEELDLFDKLPAHLRTMIPDKDHRAMRVFVDGNRKAVTCKVIKNGENLEIEQTEEGPITVRRTDEDGNEGVVTYDTEDELAKGDPEAFELYKSTDHHFTVSVYDDDEALPDGMLKFDISTDEWQRDLEDWQSQLETSFGAAQQAYAEALQQLQTLKSTGHFGAFPGHDTAQAQVRNSFEVRPDGTIEARTRKGDSELVRLFNDEEDLAQRNPTLHAKFSELMDVAE